MDKGLQPLVCAMPYMGSGFLHLNATPRNIICRELARPQRRCYTSYLRRYVRRCSDSNEKRRAERRISGAGVVKLADTLGSGPSAFTGVGVQVPSPAPFF